MTIQYQQNNINQDGDSKNIVFDPADNATVDLFGGGGGVAFVDATLYGGNVQVRLPLAREAGRNAEVTIIRVGGGPNNVDVGAQTSPDGTVDTLFYNLAFVPGITLGNDWESSTWSSDGISTWTLTATTQT